jgi:benzoate-CoA ligase family protein
VASHITAFTTDRPACENDVVGNYNAAAWLVDRHLEQGRGDRIAIRCDGASLTYADLQREVFRAQRAISDRGVQPGERLAMVVNDEPGFVAFFLAAIRSGAIPVPLSTMLTGPDIASIVDDAGATLLVASAEHADRLAEADTPAGRVVIGDESWAAYDDRSEVAVADTDEASIAFWLYSSGTTGRPKGVMHRHASLQATADTYARTVLDTGEDDRFLSVAKLFFAYGLGNSLTFPFAVGATTILSPTRPTPNGMLRLVADEQPTLFFASPGFVAAILDAEPDPVAFSSVRATVTAGESLPADLHRRFTETFGHDVLDGIGTTEALHIFLSNRLGDQVAGSSGKPVDGYEANLLDDAGSMIDEPEVPGYLHVRGPSIAAGYWQRPEATAAAFLPGGWLRTGDVYTRSAEGHWTFLGRNNDMIKAGGIWVSPAEVESVLIRHPDVLEAAVVGARDEAGLEQTVAFVVARADREIDPADIERHCRAEMAAFKRPKRLFVIDELPKTATGKIRRFELRNSIRAG